MPIISNFPGGSGSGGGGLTLAAATNIKTLTAHEKVYIQWTDPEDIVVAGSTLASWGGTLLVRKAGSMPTSRRDGVIVLDSKTRDAYKTTYFCDNGLTDGTTYYYKLFPYTTTNSYTDVDEDGFSATPDAVALGNVSGIALAPAGNGKLSIKWTDPAATVVSDGITLATWASTVVVVKAGSYATSPTDSDAAFTYTSTTRNGYATNALIATGLTNGTTYYVSLFPTSTDGKVNTATANRKSGVANRITISNVPSQSGALTYNGNSQSPTWSNYNSTQLTLGGTTSGTNADSYNATFTPKDDYMWSDGSTEAKSVSWSIGRATIATDPGKSGSLTYNGSAQSPTWTGYDSAKMTIGGDTSKTNAGNYTATFTPNSNYQWSDGSTGAKNVAWSIAKLSLSAPTANTTNFTYNGNGQIPTFTYSSAYITMGGTTAAQVNANTYTTTFTLKDVNNTQWSGGATAAKSISWTINKAAGSLTLSTSSVTLNSSHLTASVTVTRPGDGTITASSNNTGVATVSVSGTTVTIHNVNQTTGTATITINVAAGTNYTAPSSKTVSVTAQFMPAKKALNDQTWAEIRQVSDAGQGANYWSVGDRKGVLVNGTVGTLAVNTTLYVYILGFNHNSTKEGAGIQFGTFKSALSGGTDVCLVDSYYGSYQSYNGTKYFQMNHWGTSSNYNTNYGGWKACDMRYDILGSTNQAPSGYGAQKATSVVGYDAPANTATSPVANTLMAALPYDLRAVMKPITKYTNNVGNSSNAAGSVTASVDYLPLLAEFEIFGSRSYANQYEQNSQAQYAYYSAGNSKVKYRHSATGSTAIWWERSPLYTNAAHFCAVGTNGAATNTRASISLGLAPAFMV